MRHCTSDLEGIAFQPKLTKADEAFTRPSPTASPGRSGTEFQGAASLEIVACETL
jgi:hypothetical protein